MKKVKKMSVILAIVLLIAMIFTIVVSEALSKGDFMNHRKNNEATITGRA